MNNLQAIISTGRKDADFDLFYRKVQMAENFLNLPPEAMNQIYMADFYTEFWRLVGESHRVTKFAEEEKNFSQQILERARQENNPVRQQYFFLALLMFGKFQEVRRLLNYNLWSFQLRQDFEAFEKWNRIVSSPPPPSHCSGRLRNEQILAFLQEKYSDLIKKYSRSVIDEKNCPRVRSEDYQIYFCWLQGEKNLPPIVRCCYNSLKQNAGHYKIVFIDEKNFSEYVDIAPHVMDKFRAGKITRTHFSDILRINLLERHGGLWLDSTVLVTEPLENHKLLLEKFYLTQKFYRERDLRNFFAGNPTFGMWAGNIQGTTLRHNPLHVFVKEFLNSYWRDFDEMIDYLLMDFGAVLAYRNIPVVKEMIDDVPINNAEYIYLQGSLNLPYAQFPYDKILNGTFLHKLSWKVPLDMKTPGTVFREIQRRYAPETIE